MSLSQASHAGKELNSILLNCGGWRYSIEWDHLEIHSSWEMVVPDYCQAFLESRYWVLAFDVHSNQSGQL